MCTTRPCTGCARTGRAQDVHKIMIVYFLLPFLISLILIPILKKYAEKKRIFDIAEGDELKIHKNPISIFGGLAIMIAFIAGILVFAFYDPSFICKISAIISSSLIIFLFGFWDDLKWKHISQIKPHLKFLFLIIFPLAAGLTLWSAGIKIDFFPIILLSIFLNFLYIFIFINGLNYQDGMDGLAGGLVLISLIGFITLSLIFGNNFALILSLILLGAVFGFLIFNFPPAKIFMGDSGAYFLGFVLSVLAMLFSKPYNIWSILGPVFIVGVPVWDGVFTNIRRLLKGKSILLGDRSHFYDRFLQKGFSTQKTLLISYSFQAISVIIGIILITF